MKAHLDFETRSKLDLTRVGLWAYALHPSTDVMCLAIGTRAHGIDVLKRAELITPKPNAYWLDYPLFSAQNAPFEYAIYNLILHRRYGWPARWDPKSWTCSMARAAMCGLPLDLDERSRVLEYKTPKDLEGRRVMLELSSPRADGTFDEDRAKYERLYKYCATDVAVEMEDDTTLPELPASEKEIWNLDLVMNRRGVMLDLDLAAKAAPIADALIAPLNKRLQVATKGAIDKATQVQAIRHWLETQGVQTPSLDKVALTDLLARPDLPPHVREVINVRRQVGKKTSVAKYQAALDMACPDGRARGQLQYFGSHTGRWAGRGLQPHNMPKGFKSGEQLAAVARIKEGDAGLFDLAYGDKGMDVLSDTLRGLFISAPDKTFLCADFNAIEARVLFWEAGETAALAAYTAGKSPYVDMARYIYRNEAITKESHPVEYDIGKRTILGAGFGMGWETFRDNIYAETAKLGKAVKLSDEISERAVKSYREKYPNVVRLWYAMEAAAINAVRRPGECFQAANGKVLWGMNQDRRFLVCRLPSGRHLWYYKPSLVRGKTPWGEEKDELRYWATHPKTKEWCRLHTYGGKLVENVTQAIARDLLANGMLKVEAAGYETLLTVHDEVLAETSLKNPSVESFIKTMCDVPPWALGCPVAAEGWTGSRYHK